MFLPYDEFPWFKDRPVREILNVEEPQPGHFYWPELDVDLTEEIIEHPERFPKRAKHITNKVSFVQQRVQPDAGKLSGGEAGRARWQRRLRRTLCGR